MPGNSRGKVQDLDKPTLGSLTPSTDYLIQTLIDRAMADREAIGALTAAVTGLIDSSDQLKEGVQEVRASLETIGSQHAKRDQELSLVLQNLSRVIENHQVVESNRVALESRKLDLEERKLGIQEIDDRARHQAQVAQDKLDATDRAKSQKFWQGLVVQSANSRVAQALGTALVVLVTAWIGLHFGLGPYEVLDPSVLHRIQRDILLESAQPPKEAASDAEAEAVVPRSKAKVTSTSAPEVPNGQP